MLGVILVHLIHDGRHPVVELLHPFTQCFRGRVHQSRCLGGPVLLAGQQPVVPHVHPCEPDVRCCVGVKTGHVQEERTHLRTKDVRPHDQAVLRPLDRPVVGQLLRNPLGLAFQLRQESGLLFELCFLGLRSQALFLWVNLAKRGHPLLDGIYLIRSDDLRLWVDALACCGLRITTHLHQLRDGVR